MAGIRRLNHAVLFVSDLESALTFYTDILGFQVLSREPR
jgi:catechol 2,3-dioxygenase-like lactoylglutathione lyase family enzyme